MGPAPRTEERDLAQRPEARVRRRATGGAGRRGGRAGRAPRSLPATALAIALAAALAAGCTGEDRNAVGTGLVDVGFDTLADTITSTRLTAFGEVSVSEAAIPYQDLQLLYVGRQDAIRSSLVASYDAERLGFLADSLGVTVIDTANVLNLNLLLYTVSYYATFRQPDSTLVTKVYEVRQLAEPLDPALYPGHDPALLPGVVGRRESGPETPILIPLDEEAILGWLDDPQAPHGLVVGEVAAQSDPGLIGFAARYFPYPRSQLPGDGQLEGTKIGPVLQIEFREPAVTVILQPTQDVSTLTGLGPVPTTPAAGILLRTHLRVYPRFWFDLSELPANALINKAALLLTPDSTLSFGPPLEVVVGEVDSTVVHADAVELTSLPPAVRVVTGRYGVDPEAADPLALDVTTTIQRHVNDAFPAPVQFMLLAGEDFTGYDVGITDPEYELSRLFFRGTATSDPLERPRLRIVYTLVGALGDGGGEP